MRSVSILILLSGCATATEASVYNNWQPTEYPVRVEVSEKLGSVQFEATLRAIDMWNKKVGARVLSSVVLTDDFTSGSIHITDEIPPPGSEASAERYYDHCSIKLGAAEYTVTAAHEIGHCLGLDHEEDPISVMFHALNPLQIITQQSIQLVRESMR